MLFAKSPMQMRREAEARLDPKRRDPKPPRPKPKTIEPEGRPLLDGATFSAYLRTGRLSQR